MDKIVIALSIISFWIFLPFVMGLAGIVDYSSLGDTIKEMPQQPTLLNYIDVMMGFIWFFMMIIFFTIPNAPVIVNFFLLALKFATIVTAYLLIRGE